MQGGLTYEKLFDFLREERNNVQLQKLPDSFYQDIVEYLQIKEDLVKSELENNSVTAESSSDQLRNAKKIIENVYERREKKILLLALHKSRTKSQLIDTSSLLQEEKVFFKQITILLNHFREEIVLKLLKKENPEINEEKDGLQPEGANSPLEEELFSTPADKDTVSLSEAAPLSVDVNDSESSADSSVIAVKITAYVDKFVGPDLDIIGPYEEGSVQKVPKDIAEMLISKGSAEEL